MTMNIMKKSILAVCALLLCGGLQAQVTWHSIEEASKARIGSRLYFVDFYTSWCGYCKKMDRETFTDPTVAKLLNRYYYPVKFNAEGNNTFVWKGQSYGPGTANRTHSFANGLRGYPSFVLYKADGTVIQVIPGFYKADPFAAILWYFASGDNQRYPSFDHYMQLFDKEIRPQMEKALAD